jgi:hypothetical protein
MADVCCMSKELFAPSIPAAFKRSALAGRREFQSGATAAGGLRRFSTRFWNGLLREQGLNEIAPQRIGRSIGAPRDGVIAAIALQDSPVSGVQHRVPQRRGKVLSATRARHDYLCFEQAEMTPARWRKVSNPCRDSPYDLSSPMLNARCHSVLRSRIAISVRALSLLPPEGLAQLSLGRPQADLGGGQSGKSR